MFGRETFIVRVAEDAMAPRVRAGDYVWIDPDEPAVDGRLVAVRDPARGGETVVRSDASHCAADFGLRQVGRCRSITAAAAWRNVGAFDRLSTRVVPAGACTAPGSWPALASLRYSSAISRACERDP